METSENRLTGWTWITVLCAAIYLAILPMADTIAMRGVAMAGLVALIILRLRTEAQGWRECFVPGWVIPAAMWVTYLLLFPLFAEQAADAWRSLGQIWYRGILALAVGAGLALVLRRQSRFGTVFQWGLVTTVPLVIHLALVGWKVVETSSIPWNYWGRETHHADLGYAAGQAVVLLAVALVAVHTVKRSLALGLIGASILSVIVAQSRAGIGFALLGLLLVFVVYWLSSGARRRWGQLAILVAVLAAIATVALFAARFDPRWMRMTDRLTAGFYGDSLQIECEGTAQVEQELIKKFGSGERAQDLVMSVQGSDGARMVLMRAGLRLAVMHPWGLDGSRQAFQKRLKEYCSNPASSQIAHTHNGWLDTVLALGWIGAGLYLLVLGNFLRLGIAGLRAGGEGVEWAYVLVVLSIFWILRGFTDSVFRDHQLEMQGFVLAYAAVALKLRSGSRQPAGLVRDGA